MRPIDLYLREPIRTDYDSSVLFTCYHNHVPDFIGNDYEIDHSRNTKIQIRYLQDFNFDHRRVWRLATVWFNVAGEFQETNWVPVMIIQNAGREGDDFHHTYLTSKKAYERMVVYLESLLPIREIFATQDQRFDVVDELAEVGDSLIEFYGNRLDEHFERY